MTAAAHAEARCPRCRETVTPVRDLATSALVCPWCDGPVSAPEAPRWRYCPACDADLLTGPDLRCPSCHGQTNNSLTCPSCGGRKAGQSDVCVACVPRDAGGHHASTRPRSETCPSCGGRKTTTAQTCWRCFVAGGGPAGRHHRKGAGLRKIDPPTLLRARALYDQGLSIRAVAREILPGTGYTNAHSAATSLFDLFAARGWPLRERAAATAAANAARVWRAQCVHVFSRGRKAGTRCPRRAIGDDGYCWHHRPENIAAGIARLRRSEAR